MIFTGLVTEAHTQQEIVGVFNDIRIGIDIDGIQIELDASPVCTKFSDGKIQFICGLHLDIREVCENCSYCLPIVAWYFWCNGRGNGSKPCRGSCL